VTLHLINVFGPKCQSPNALYAFYLTKKKIYFKLFLKIAYTIGYLEGMITIWWVWFVGNPN
jgi:hypothetical protein